MKGTTEKTISKEEGLLSNFLGPLIKVGLPLKKNVLTALTKSFPILSGLSVAPPVTDGAIRKKFIWIRHDYPNNHTKRNRRHHKSGLLTKSTSETIENEEKEQNDGFLERVIRYIKC